MCMESKDPGMGLPAGGATSTGPSTMAAPVHNGSSETASIRPDAVRPTLNADINLAHPGADPTRSTAPSSSHFRYVPSPYMPGTIMTTAIMPVFPGGFSFISSSPGLGFESMKKKRGRPRKYGPDSALALTVAPLSALSPSPLSPSQKRGRGRPPGSGKNQQLAALGELMLGSIGAGFTPHAITVATGEDIAARIMSFSQHGPRGICILSANGAISTVTLRQPSRSGGIVTYEGRFEILSLSGSFLMTEYGGARARTGGISISVAGPDGRVVGGSVAGGLMAASPVQVIVGSFLCHNKKLPKPPRTEAPPGLARPHLASNAAVLNSTLPKTSACGLGPNLSMGNPERKPETREIPATAVLDQRTVEASTATANVGSSPKPQDQAMPPQSMMVEPPNLNEGKPNHGDSSSSKSTPAE